MNAAGLHENPCGVVGSIDESDSFCTEKNDSESQMKDVTRETWSRKRAFLDGGCMKNQIAESIGLFLLVVAWPSAASADAVVTWNENAAKAATAACLHMSGNGLAESRMYAMVHVAVHDAVNAIDRRSRPYAFDVRSRAASLPLMRPSPPRRATRSSRSSGPAGVAGVPYGRNRRCQQLVCCCACRYTRWARQNRRRGGGASSRSGNHRAAGQRRIGCAAGGFRLSARDRTR